MVDLILSVSQAIMVIALLFFFYKKEESDKVYKKNLEDKVMSLPEDLQTKIMESVQMINIHVADISSQNFASYLKHIRELEKMVLPQPVTQAAVEDVLSRGTPLVENEISKQPGEESIDLNEENFKNIPLGPNTKVKFDFQAGDIADYPPTLES